MCNIKHKSININNLFSVAIILILISCNFLKLNKSSKSIDENKILFNSKYLHTDSSGFTFFVCEDFVSNALNDYTIATINKDYLNILKCSRESVINSHDHAVVDTVYTFFNSGNKIQIYRAKQNDFIFTFNVTDPIFKLTGNIKPGMAKELFSRNFNITVPTNNKVQIVNSEGSMRLMFYFENNILKRINSYLYLD
jgi:hypothetical protein